MTARYFPLAVFLLLVVTASYIATGFEAGEWYHSTMRQPSWTPPHWLYGPAWALVYVMMAMSAWKIWMTGHYSRTGALVWWLLLLLLNVAWSALFFSLHRPGWALPVLGLTLGLTVFCMRSFGRLSRDTVLLMAPYLVWIGFLTLLNFMIWSLNGGLLEHLVL
jgi:tryptophan-rich sensory protein